MTQANAQLDAALALYRAGRLDEALASFERVAASSPAAASARSFRGLILCHQGRFTEGIADLEAAAAAEPRIAGHRLRLGTALFAFDRLPAAEEQLRRALALAPGNPEGLNNLGLVLRARGDFGGAERAARQALAARAEFPEARVNLGYALLAQGKFADAWPHHDYRPNARVNLRDPAAAVDAPHGNALPPAGAPIIVHGEQGLGDALFFLRFAAALRERGHRLAFWGDSRLHGMLSRTGLFEHFLRPEARPGEGLALLWAGDLPGLLHAADATRLPPPLALKADGARRVEWLKRLQAWGPPPYIGLTWRAGQPRGGQVVLSKAIAPELLGAAMRERPGTLVSLQRKPAAGEIELLATAAGRPVHDASMANDDLEDALALMELLDDYVGVSNTNTHLRAGTGKGATVLVPWPPEWRWLAAGERSPWFPAMKVLRQEPGGAWPLEEAP